MNTIDRSNAHKHLTTKHETMAWMSDLGRVSVRKTAGRYIVTFEDFTYDKVTKSDYATLPGALVAAETLKEYSL